MSLFIFVLSGRASFETRCGFGVDSFHFVLSDWAPFEMHGGFAVDNVRRS